MRGTVKKKVSFDHITYLLKYIHYVTIHIQKVPFCEVVRINDIETRYTNGRKEKKFIAICLPWYCTFSLKGNIYKRRLTDTRQEKQ